MMDATWLRGALVEMQEYEVSQFPTPSEEDLKLPILFRIRMNNLMDKHDHPVLHEVKKVTAIIILFLGIMGSLVLGINEKARANVWNWIMERVGNNEFQYHSLSNIESDVSEFTLDGNIPEGYRFIKRYGSDDKITEIYSDNEGNLLTFMVLSASYDGNIYIVSDENTMKDPVYIESMSAELYLSQNQGEASTITWQNSKGIRFIIQGVLDEKQLIELAKIFYN